MSGIDVEITSSALAVNEAWRELVRHAPVNVFMDPVALNTVIDTHFADLRVLLAWDRQAKPAKLVGLWALRRAHATPLGPAMLSAPPYEYSFLSGPVIDPARVDEVVPAFLAAIASDRSLPKVIRLKYLDGGSPTTGALLRSLGLRARQMRQISERDRPFASREAGQKSSGSTRKKLRQDWKRLSAVGEADVVNDRTPDQVRAAFETFLAIEAASWKGAERTALLSHADSAAFARRLIGNLAEAGQASVALLRLDGKAIAAQVLLYCGTTAYTWKTAFDAGFAKFSPGALLVDRITADLLAGDIEGIESCSPEGGFMAQLWSGRRSTIDLLADVGTRWSPVFAIALLHESGYAELKALRNRLRACTWFPSSRHSLPAGE